jgi:hypothetical protein
MSEPITALPVASTIDAVQDVFPIVTNSTNTTQQINRNTFLGLASAPVGLTDTQNVTNKTFNNTNTLTVKDGSITLQNSSSITKQAQFSLASITAGNTRTYTVPDYNGTLATLAGTETLTNKTLTSPTINSPTITNATLSADTISGYSAGTTGTIYGMSVTSGTIGSSALASSSVTTAAIATGIQLPDKMKNPYKFSVYLNSAQGAGSNTWDKILLDTKNFDTSSNFDVATNHRFTVPVSGFYFIQSQVGLTPAGASANTVTQSALYKNGSALIYSSQNHMFGDASEVPNNVICGLFQLTAGDYLESYGRIQDPGRSYTNAITTTFMTGFLVSAT